MGGRFLVRLARGGRARTPVATSGLLWRARTSALHRAFKAGEDARRYIGLLRRARTSALHPAFKTGEDARRYIGAFMAGEDARRYVGVFQLGGGHGHYTGAFRRYNHGMGPRIAIPVPHSGDFVYAERALPQYMQAVEMAGGEPVRVPLNHSPTAVMKVIERCDAVLLPGSKADVDPAKYDAAAHPKTTSADARRDTVDELLLQDAYNMRKPVLGICYGLQTLNVYRKGTLLQHIDSPVNHEAGRKVSVAHMVAVDPGSSLGEIVAQGAEASEKDAHSIAVNSSHHQAAEIVGDGLRVVARCAEDGIIEGLEGTASDHFVLAVQWHPERSIEDDGVSRAIFRAFVKAAHARRAKLVGTA